jgi:hypothetical protein
MAEFCYNRDFFVESCLEGSWNLEYPALSPAEPCLLSPVSHSRSTSVVLQAVYKDF